LPTILQTIVDKIAQIENEWNRAKVSDFHDYLKRRCGECHQKNSLFTIIAFAHYLAAKDFTDVRNEEVKHFLNVKLENGKWVEKVRDSEGKWVSSYNLRMAICRRFFRWFHSKGEEEQYWKTPKWWRIKAETCERLGKGPYTQSQIWSEQEMLSILKYEPVVRNKAIITMMWDMAGRNHEITSLKMKDLIFHDFYADGEIPRNTKTGGGPFMLTLSFPYARDWFNKHPRKNDDNAHFICNARTSDSMTPDAIRGVTDRLRKRIADKVKKEVLDEKESKQMEYLLKRKAWNPYIFRHSNIILH
jgi:integrase/recombinase XerD